MPKLPKPTNEKLRGRKMINILKLCMALVLGALLSLGSLAQEPAAQPVHKAGTVKAINGNVITLQPETGEAVQITVPEGARIRRLAAGQTDLKSAPTITLQDVQVGDRMLAAVKPGDQGALTASSVVIMKQSDVAQKQQQDRMDWQRRGVGGIVTAIDAASGAITVSGSPTLSFVVKTTPSTQYLRYAPESVKFADAKRGTFDQIKTGDQLRAKGDRTPDGKEITAQEIISGTFRNIAGTVSSVDTANKTVSVKDLISKKTVAIKITADTQLRKLTPEMARGLAFLMKGGAGESAQPGRAPSGAPTGQGAPGNGQRGLRGGGLDQMLSRVPTITLADLQKDEAVMIVSTAGNSEVSAITLLSGVEPILTASPNAAGAAALLSGWNLSAPGEGGPQ